MKNKGFTLVELLAVIAILAILVIVAMPNVLGMFNEAKVNVFVTDVQRYMDAATTSFTKDALNNAGKTIYYSSVDNDDLNTKKLSMSGSDKEYFIEIDRNGNFKRVVVYDDNYCYDIYSDGTTIKRTGSKSKLISDKISKTTVNRSDIWESGSDTVAVSGNGSNSSLKGCDAKITFGGDEVLQTLPEVEIDGVKYKYVPGMTWSEWLASEYNTSSEFKEYLSEIRKSECNSGICDVVNLRYNTHIYSNISWYAYIVFSDHEIILNEKYFFVDLGVFPIATSGLSIGQKYYDFNDNGGNVIHNQVLKTNNIDGFGASEGLGGGEW